MLPILLIAFPLLAALILFVSKRNGARNLALLFSGVEFVLAIVAFAVYKNDPTSELLSHDCVWIKSLGIHFNIAIDALGLLMIMLTTFLIPIIILSSFKKGTELSQHFYALILALEMAVIGVFTANDGFLFYVFWEFALIPAYLICLLWGGENRGRITLKFFIYTLIGSLFMLIGLIYIYNFTDVAGAKSWNILAMYDAGNKLTIAEQGSVFCLIFVAFAIKMPVFPFHTWQPDTYVNAPVQGTMLLSGIVLKMATFGSIKWLLPMVPAGVAEWGTAAMVLAAIGVVYASIIAIGQTEYKRFIAYTSIAHVGIIAAAILSVSFQGIQGSIMFMLAHGINAVGLFFIGEILFRHLGTTDMNKMGGIRLLNGNFSTLFLIILLGAVSLPLTNGFVGEFLSLMGIYQYSAYIGLFAGLSVILGAVYMLRAFQKIMLGESKDPKMTFGKLETSETVVLVIIAAAVIGLGVYPGPFNEVAETASKDILMYIK